MKSPYDQMAFETNLAHIVLDRYGSPSDWPLKLREACGALATLRIRIGHQLTKEFFEAAVAAADKRPGEPRERQSPLIDRLNLSVYRQFGDDPPEGVEVAWGTDLRDQPASQRKGP